MNTYSSDTMQIETDNAVVESELNRLLGIKRFSGAPQMSAFLRYIVTETLKGNGDRIKAYSVGVDALGKPASFDAQSDPSVRVLALRLRKTLAAAYQDDDKPLAVIDLRVGTYVPEFFKADSRHGYAQENAKERSHATVHDVVHDGVRDSVRVIVPAIPANTGVSSTTQAGHPTVSANESAQHGPTSPSALIDNQKPEIPETANKSVGSGSSAAQQSSETRKTGLSHKGWIIACAVLAIATWKIALHDKAEPEQLTQVSSTSALPVLAAAVLQSDPASENAASTLPTLYLPSLDLTPGIKRYVMSVLSPGLVQAGTLNVIRVTPTDVTRLSSAGEYFLILDGFSVGKNFHVQAQVVSLRDGEMMYATSVVIDQPASNFSAETLGKFEHLADALTDLHGPLYKDYCSNRSLSESADCAVL